MTAIELHAAGLLQHFLQWYFPPAQRATDYKRWLTATTPYEIAFESGYEPYGIVARPRLPLFDVRFRGYGMVRMSTAASTCALQTAMSASLLQVITRNAHAEQGAAA